MKIFIYIACFCFYINYAVTALSAKTAINESTKSSKTTTSFLKSYENKLGHCEPLTVDFLASLVSKKARQLLYFEKTPTQRILQFDLYTRRNPYERQILNTNDYQALYTSNFNNEWPIRLSIHGWNGQTKSCSNAAIKDAYLAKGDFNVILVDWSAYSLDINYVRVADEVFEIAAQITNFTRFLHSATGIPYANMYLIGHSLGVNVAAAAGKLLKPDLYGVIYALDAAGPLFYDPRTPSRLLPSDAMYVESIQTDISLLGLPTANMAHASFYPNWGLGQRHCPNETAMEADFMCDHFSSLYFFAESIRNEKSFGAIKCKNFMSIQKQNCRCPNHERVCNAETYMGGEPAVPKRGIYYLSTRRKEPFGYGGKCRIKPPLASTIRRLDMDPFVLMQKSGVN